jgi:hypothetical protein
MAFHSFALSVTAGTRWYGCKLLYQIQLPACCTAASIRTTTSLFQKLFRVLHSAETAFNSGFYLRTKSRKLFQLKQEFSNEMFASQNDSPEKL